MSDLTIDRDRELQGRDQWDELTSADRFIYACGHAQSTANTFARLRDQEGRTELGRKLAILATDAEKTAALASAWLEMK